MSNTTLPNNPPAYYSHHDFRITQDSIHATDSFISHRSSFILSSHHEASLTSYDPALSPPANHTNSEPVLFGCFSVASANPQRPSLHLATAQPASALTNMNASAMAILCPRCNLPTKDIRSHMGAHVLRAVRGLEEPLISPIAHLSPCGFCGRSQVDHPECGVKLKVMSSHGVEMLTDCPCRVRIKFAYADRGSKSKPCRNIPVICPLCPLPPRTKETAWQPAIWRYNMEQHINFHHPEYAHPGKNTGMPLPSTALAALLVDSREEAKFGVPHRPVFTNVEIIEQASSMAPPKSAREKRRHTNASAGATDRASGSKRVRTD